MLTFSNSSMLMSVLFSNILLMVLYFIFRNTKLMMDIGYKLLVLFITITVLRLLFPFEIAYSTNIYFPQDLSNLIICFKTDFIRIGNHSLSIWHISLMIWAAGSAITMIRYLLRRHSFHAMILSLGTDISAEEPYHSLLDAVCQKHDKKNLFHIVKLYGITSPMITGIRRPYILIPEDFDADIQDMYYIFSHEAAHFFHHDLLLKLFSEFLCILYWWNPFVVLLKRQIATMLELRIDLQITNSPDPQERINYLNCLIRAARAEASVSTFAETAISFCNTNESLLTQRFSIIMNAPRKKADQRKQLLFSLFIIGLYIISIVFIFEPFFIPEDIEGFWARPDNAYLIENPDGTYDFYCDNEYKSTLPRVDDSMADLTIYQYDAKQAGPPHICP